MALQRRRAQRANPDAAASGFVDRKTASTGHATLTGRRFEGIATRHRTWSEPAQTRVSDHGRHVGRVGALAIALGIGAAIATLPATASADTTSAESAGAHSTASESGSRAESSPATAPPPVSGPESGGSSSGRSSGTAGDRAVASILSNVARSVDSSTTEDSDIAVDGLGADAAGEDLVLTVTDDMADAQLDSDSDVDDPSPEADPIAENLADDFDDPAGKRDNSHRRGTPLESAVLGEAALVESQVDAVANPTSTVSNPTEVITEAESDEPARFDTSVTPQRSTAMDVVNAPSVMPTVASDASGPVYGHVEQALQQLSAAQSELVRGTWGNGNLLAGLAALLPQMFIARARTSLQTWKTSNDDALTFFADTEGNPIAHSIARLNLAINELLPSIAQTAMDHAQFFMPVVGWFGASLPATEAATLVAEAQLNGMVYAAVPITMGLYKNPTQAFVNISVNGGESIPVLLDTGSQGLIFDPDYIGSGKLGPIDNSACQKNNGDHCVASYVSASGFAYDVYTTTVAFGDGIVTAPTYVGILTPDPENLANWRSNVGFAGILGVGPNAGGPTTGPDGSVTSALPGELYRGMLLNETGRYLNFGPNTRPARAKLGGLPVSELVVKFDDGDLIPVKEAIFDTGGSFGFFSADLVPEAWKDKTTIPVGTNISVYAPDGKTLLYSYTTTEENKPVIEADLGYFNTGYQPFQSGSLYLDLRWNSEHAKAGSVAFNYAWW